MLTDTQKGKLLTAQKNEITEYLIYRKLASIIKDKSNSKILQNISQDEKKHYEFWKSFTKEQVAPDRIKVFFYVFISRAFGITFGVKLMEKGEESAQVAYRDLKELDPKVEKVINDEENHEKELINLIDEERLKYVSSMVLGLNDALVELTGALAGFTLALQNTKLIAAVGLVTGIAASMSMAASEYLSTKEEKGEKNPLKAAVYTGIAYIFTVLFLMLPYFFLANIFLCLGVTLFNAILIVFVFTFYISVAKDLSFKNKFFEMAGLSLSIAAVSFFIGFAIRKVFGMDI